MVREWVQLDQGIDQSIHTQGSEEFPKIYIDLIGVPTRQLSCTL